MDSTTEVKYPTARRSGRPLGKADSRPEANIWLDAPTGITDGAGKLTHLEIGNEVLTFGLNLPDGTWVICELRYPSGCAIFHSTP